jgi:MFS family permease
MPPTESQTITIAKRRRGLRILVLNAVLASVGYCVAIETSLLYFGSEHLGNFRFREILLLLAAIFAVSRLAAPVLIRRLDGLRVLAIAASIATACVLAALPVVPRVFPTDDRLAMRVCAGLFLLFVACEAIGSVAIWTWIGELVPEQVRGKYLGWRESMRCLALAPTLIVAGYIALSWRTDRMSAVAWLEHHSLAVWVGCLFLLAAALVLLGVRDVKGQRDAKSIAWRELIKPVLDPHFSRLILFGVWTSFFMALSLPAMEFFPRYTLEVWAVTPFLLLAAAKLGQSAISPWIGRSCDSFGNVPVILISQIVAAFAPFFYLPANPQQSWWIGIATVFLVGQAGIQLGLTNLMFKLSPTGQRSAYIAVFSAATCLAFAVGNIVGYFLLELLTFQKFRIAGWNLDDYEYVFYMAWTTQLMGLLILIGLKEPGSASLWTQFTQRLGRSSQTLVSEPAMRHPLD